MKKLKRLFAEESFLKRLHAKKTFGLFAAGTGLMALGAQAQAQTIIQDNFTKGNTFGTFDGGFAAYNDNVGAPGLTPDGANLPGGYYYTTGINNYSEKEYSGTSGSGYTFGSINNFASTRSDDSFGISIASSGSYVEPDALNIVGNFNVEGKGTGANEAYLGFYSKTSGSSYSNRYNDTQNLVGLGLTNTGSLDFVVNGTKTATGIAPGAGIFDANGFTTLSYNLTFNPSTDVAAFSNIVLDGVSYSATYTTGTLSPNAINYAGFGGSSTDGNIGAAIDSFTVSGVVAAPEPSTYSLLAGGAFALSAFHYRRRRQAGI